LTNLSKLPTLTTCIFTLVNTPTIWRCAWFQL
jgi:hypothetical protein